MTLKKYIKNKKTKHFIQSGINVFIKDELPNSIDIKSVISKMTNKVPSFLLRNLESIYVGHFKQLIDRDIQAMYENSSIFITNQHKDEEDMLDDLVHEVGHSVEEIYKYHLYFDRKIEKEFVNKRKQLWHQLKKEGLDTNLSYFLETEYRVEFDEYLYKQVGYRILSMITSNLFYSPYAATSLREYFANGFEAFFMKEDLGRLKVVSPILYKKIVELLQKKEKE